jgi:hypothetical protein
VYIKIVYCNDLHGGTDQAIPDPIEGDFSGKGRIIQSITAKFSIWGTSTEETISDSSKYCDTPKKASTCGGFSIPKRVPQSRRTPVSFKGPGNITRAKVYFKNLKYSLSVRLQNYDWGSKTWYGYINTTYLPTGKHHGHVITYVDGVRGGGCATGGFKVVDE